MTTKQDEMLAAICDATAVPEAIFFNDDKVAHGQAVLDGLNAAGYTVVPLTTDQRERTTGTGKGWTMETWGEVAAEYARLAATPGDGLPERGFAENRPTGPRTRDGHALAFTLRRRGLDDADWDAWIRTIEDQAAALLAATPGDGLDVERLAAALWAAHPLQYPASWPGYDPNDIGPSHREDARAIAAEYARLAATEQGERT
jgi:hypothetical protein